jgi:hypothetical protein
MGTALRLSPPLLFFCQLVKIEGTVPASSRKETYSKTVPPPLVRRVIPAAVKACYFACARAGIHDGGMSEYEKDRDPSSEGSLDTARSFLLTVIPPAANFPPFLLY